MCQDKLSWTRQSILRLNHVLDSGRLFTGSGVAEHITGPFGGFIRECDGEYEVRPSEDMSVILNATIGR
jgi:hypothetical protein